jgi:hypothetical protein
MTKYQKYFEEMMAQNKQLFEEFKTIHDQYSQDPKSHQDKFNEVGADVLDVIRRYENRLCSKTEGSGFGKFSSNLADKFRAEVKAYFPKIDSVGLIL